MRMEFKTHEIDKRTIKTLWRKYILRGIISGYLGLSSLVGFLLFRPNNSGCSLCLCKQGCERESARGRQSDAKQSDDDDDDDKINNEEGKLLLRLLRLRLKKRKKGRWRNNAPQTVQDELE